MILEEIAEKAIIESNKLGRNGVRVVGCAFFCRDASTGLHYALVIDDKIPSASDPDD